MWRWTLVLVMSLYPFFAYSFIFQFNNTDDSRNYRIFSASLQNVEQNTGIPRASFEQAYEAFLRTQDADIERKTLSLKGEYHYSQRLFRSQEAFNAVDRDKVYKSFFSRNKNGKIQVFSQEDYYPSVRSVPVFPSTDIKIGDTWNDLGVEAQDFSLLHYKQPFLVPFYAKYQYLQDITLSPEDFEKWVQKYKQYDFDIEKELSNFLKWKPSSKQGLELAIIHVFYTVDYSAQEHIEQTRNMEKQNGNPVQEAKGFYHGLVFWNKSQQEEVLDIGAYDFTYLWKNKEERRWSGKEYGIVTLLEKNKEAIEKLAKKAQNIDKYMEVTKQEQGVKLILGDLLFHFNKTSLRPQVILTLSQIVELLKDNPHAAIHITGHSDDIGSLQAKERIADGRAKTVANFFIKRGIDSSRITFAGAADRKPRVSNTSADNRRKNRRVEIDIITQ